MEHNGTTSVWWLIQPREMYELTRGGHDVRGRYTVPFEYFVPSGRPPHIEQWIAESQRSLWSKAVEQGATFVGWISSLVGFPTAILLLAALSAC